MNININKRLGNQKLVYFPTFFEVRWAKKNSDRPVEPVQVMLLLTRPCQPTAHTVNV